MEFLLDTANIEIIKKYNEIYDITGVTTNPTIISRENCEFFPRLLKIREIIGDKQLHVQVTASTMEEMLKEARSVSRLINTSPSLQSCILAIPFLLKAISPSFLL